MAAATQKQIKDLYSSVLGREVSDNDSGFQFWANSGDSLEGISNAFKNSDEYKSKQSPTTAKPAAPASPSLTGGSSSASSQPVATSTPNSSAGTVATPDQIKSLYSSVLGREVSDNDSGFQWWANSGDTYDGIRNAFLNSDEYKNKQAANGQSGATGFVPGMATREVNAGTDTVQGQLSGLLQKENPLMQRAYYKGQDYANSRGLLNSSVGAEAAQAAMMDVALPIAQQDSSTYYNQAQTNQKHAFSAWQAGLDRQFESSMKNADQTFQQGQLDREVYANFRGQLTTAIQDLTKTTSINITEIQTSPNISAEDKATMITQQQELLQSLTNNISGLYSEAEIWQQGWATYMNEAN